VNETTTQLDRSSRMKTLFAIHGWSGVLLGLLLYAVVVTGVIAVFAHEIGDWASPLPKHAEQTFTPGVDAALRNAADTVDPRFHEEISIFHGTGGRLKAFFHTHTQQADGTIVEEGTQVHFDPLTWQVVDRLEGEALDIRQQDHLGVLARFLIDLHVRLYLPNPWGLLLTGLLGLAMLIAAVSGLVLHRKLLRELFLLRISRRNPLLTSRDRHVLAGAWNLIFAFLLAFTGSFFSFAGSFGLPVMAMVAFGGDQTRMIETVVGISSASDATPTTPANLDQMLTDAQQRADGSPVDFMFIMRWGRADAEATISTQPTAGHLTRRHFVYNVATGEFVREKPRIGLTPSLGNTLLDLMSPLHFGDFAGLPSKAIWFSLGIASAYVILSGLLLWAQRRQNQPHWQPLARLTIWMGYGLPLTLAATPVLFFSADLLGVTASTAVKGGFVFAIMLVSLLALDTAHLHVLRMRLLLGTALLLALAPVMRWFSGGMDWVTALNMGWGVIPALDILLAIAAVLCLLQWHRLSQQLTQPAQPAFSVSG